MNRKCLSMLLCISFIICCFAGCARPTPADTRLRVVATSFPVYDLARAVGGDQIALTLLCDPGTEIHDFDPTPSDLQDLQTSDVFLMIGGESDAWADRLLREKHTGRVLRLIDTVEALGESEHGHAHGHGDEEYDEHIWTSPRNAIALLDAIEQTLAEASPAQAAVFSANSERYREQLEQLDENFRNLVDQAKDPFVLIADRFPFRYFVEKYGIAYEAAFAGCDAANDPSAATMVRLLHTIEAHDLSVIYTIDLSNGRVANALAEQTGVRVTTLYSGQSISRDDFEAGFTYADLLARNLKALREGWNL